VNGRREKRRESRRRQRLSCRLTIAGREQSGIVVDVSSHGLFVQTKAKAAPGTPVRVQLSLPGREAPLLVEASVARLNRVPDALAPVRTAGIGLSVTHPPASYLDLVESFARSKGGANVALLAEPADETRSFRVRAALMQGTRTRTLLVRCASPALASELALTELGEEWKVLSVEVAPV